MSIPLTIQFHNVRHSQSAEEAVEKHLEHLEQVFDRITSCSVVVDRPHLHHQRGNHYQVRLQLSVPGKPICVSMESSNKGDFPDLHKTIRDAFLSAEKRLKAYKSKRSYRRGEKAFAA